MTGTYEVVLGPSAERLMKYLDEDGRKKLADVLYTELVDGPNSDKEVSFDANCQLWAEQLWAEETQSGSTTYTATPLSFDAFTALHRHLTTCELRLLEKGLGRPAADLGVYVVDILPAESAFIRRPRLR